MIYVRYCGKTGRVGHKCGAELEKMRDTRIGIFIRYETSTDIRLFGC